MRVRGKTSKRLSEIFPQLSAGGDDGMHVSESQSSLSSVESVIC